MGLKYNNLDVRCIVISLAILVTSVSSFAQNKISIFAPYGSILSPTNQDSVIVYIRVEEKDLLVGLPNVKVEISPINKADSSIYNHPNDTIPKIKYTNAKGGARFLMPYGSYYLKISDITHDFEADEIEVKAPYRSDDPNEISWLVDDIHSVLVIDRAPGYKERGELMRAIYEKEEKKEAKAEAKRQRRLKRQNK